MTHSGRARPTLPEYLSSFCRQASRLLAVWLLSGALAAGAALASPLDSVVGIRADVPGNARTAPSLGTERSGSGVVVDPEGLVLTIGYLILEAANVEVVLPDGRNVPADIVAYDHDTGFGLLRSLAPLAVEPIELGESEALEEGSQVLVAASGPGAVMGAVVVSRREFAGYWEYLLPDAIFTAPAHAGFGGAALIGRDGRLLGIGSLIVGDAAGAEGPMPGNMFVPIDALKPIMGDLVAGGRTKTPPKPWLGVYSEELRGHLFITRVAPEGPAAKAGLAEGDVILAVAGEPVSGQADFYRKVWALGSAGVGVPLKVLRSAGLTEITVESVNRYDYLRLKPSL